MKRRWPKATNRSLVVAACVSLVVHLALILLFLGFRIGPEPGDAHSALLVNVLLPDTGDHLSESEAGENAPIEVAETVKSPVEAELVDNDPVIAEADEIVATTASLVLDPPQLPPDPDEIEPAEYAPPPPPVFSEKHPESREPQSVGLDIIAAIVESNRALRVGDQESDRSAPSVELIHLEQQAMLNEKFADWSREFDRMDPSDPSITWEHEGRTYTTSFRKIPANADTDIEQVSVEVSTIKDGKRLSTQMRMKRLSFSNYAQLVNRWDPYVQVNDDQIDGRFHSNSEIQVGYERGTRPVFHGKVTTTFRKVNTSHAKGRVRRDEIFLGGLETGVRRIQLPRRYIPFPDDSGFGSEQVHYFDQDTRITFYPDGSFIWQPVDSEEPGQRVELTLDSAYLLGINRAMLYLSGTVEGKVLVYSPKRIIIEGDLVYAHDPVASDHPEDYLGLVSDRSIVVAEPEVTGPGDLNIYASIYAKLQFAVRSYRSREDATLYIFGSVTSGSLTATEPRFATRITFDKRLEDIRPPGFPMTDRYELDGWNPIWKVEPVVAETSVPGSPSAKQAFPR